LNGFNRINSRFGRALADYVDKSRELAVSPALNWQPATQKCKQVHQLNAAEMTLF
jgi:hypothetical protein